MNEVIKTLIHNTEIMCRYFLPFILGPMIPVLIIAIGLILFEQLEKFCQIKEEKNHQKKH